MLAIERERVLYRGRCRQQKMRNRPCQRDYRGGIYSETDDFTIASCLNFINVNPEGV